MLGSLNIAICEDTKSDCDKLVSVFSKAKFPITYDIFTSGEEFLSQFRMGVYDLILTDIYMKDKTGVDVAKAIRDKDITIPIAFITTSQDHTLEGYRLKVFRYIEKPYKDEDILEAIEAALIKKESQPSLHIYKNKREIKIPLQYITYLEQQSRNLVIHIKDEESVEIIEKISTYSNILEKGNFFESHKSFYVNLTYVRSIDLSLKCFVMQDGVNIPIRRDKLPTAKKALENFLFNKTRGL